MKIWVSRDAESGSHYMWDGCPRFQNSAGPLEISNELYERIRESEREFDAIQDILESLVYDREADCD